MTASTQQVRSQGTRDRILASARALFGQVGFDRATIRAVALRANIHPSLVMRYYGSKEGLFLASMQFDLRLPDLSKIPPKKRGKVLARHFLTRWEGPETHGELPALLRLAVTHPAGRQKLFDVFSQQVAPAILNILPPDRACTAAVHIAAGAIGLAFTRYVIELPGMVALTQEELVAVLSDAFERHL